MRFLISIMAFAASLVPVCAATNSGGDFAIATGNSLQGRPTVAHDSKRDRFLSVWSDFRNRGTTGMDVYGRVVGSDGRAVTADVPVVVARRGQANPVAAYDAANDRYLVVWADWRDAATSDSDIYGRLLDADGSPMGDAFIITSRRGVSQSTPNVAYDAVRGLFLVVWVDGRGGDAQKIYGRFLEADGGLRGDAFRLSRTGAGTEDGPSIAYDGKRQRFLVIWRDITDAAPRRGKTIFGALVEPKLGGPIGNKVLIAFEDDSCLPPTIHATSFSAEHDVFLVTWTSGRNYFDEVTKDRPFPRLKGLDVYGVFIGADDGRPRGRDFAIASKVDYQESSSVAFDPVKQRFLVVWYDLRRPPAGRSMDIYGRHISLDGTLSEEFLISDPLTPGIKRFPALSFSARSGRFLVLWEDGRFQRTNGPQRLIYGTIQ